MLHAGYKRRQRRDRIRPGARTKFSLSPDATEMQHIWRVRISGRAGGPCGRAFRAPDRPPRAPDEVGRRERRTK